jgi:AcrR family transcriptional regulator
LEKKSPRKEDARERLLEAVSALAAREGYAKVTVERVLEMAGVSRATFYQYFDSADDCFWSAYRHHAHELQQEVETAAGVGVGAGVDIGADAGAGGGADDRAELVTLRALIDAAISQPLRARLLMGESLAAGPPGMRERDRLIAGLARSLNADAERGATIDLPAAVLLGGVFRLLNMYLAQAAPAEDSGEGEEIPAPEWAGTLTSAPGQEPTARAEILEWVEVFTGGSAQPAWSALPNGIAQGRAGEARGRARYKGSPRERIVHATANVSHVNGYHASTVKDIVAEAGISRRCFYNEFAGKTEAFVAAYEYGFQQAIVACAPAFFVSAQWPERVWQSAQAFTGFFAREPVWAHLGFVESFALGREYTQRINDTVLAFTLFLEEGHRQRADMSAPALAAAHKPTRLASALTATTIAEMAHQASRDTPSLNMRRMQPLAVYVALAPFTGAPEAGSFVTEKLSAG